MELHGDSLNISQPALNGPFSAAAAQAASDVGAFSNLNNTVSKLSKADVLFITDGDHDNLKLRDQYQDPAFWENARASGRTDWYVEMPREAQPLVNRLASGQMSKQDFAQELYDRRDESFRNIVGKPLSEDNRQDSHIRELNGRLANEVSAASNAGINVHFFDPRGFDYAAAAYKAVETGDKDALGKIADSIAENDAGTADYIHQTRTGKALVTVGASHVIVDGSFGGGIRAGSMDDALEQHGATTATIEMSSRPTATQSLYESYQKGTLKLESPIDVPDYIAGSDDYVTPVKQEAAPIVQQPRPSAMSPALQ